MPNYVAHMWLRGKDGSIAAALYGPSAATFDLPNGRQCHIAQRNLLSVRRGDRVLLRSEREDGYPVSATHSRMVQGCQNICQRQTMARRMSRRHVRDSPAQIQERRPDSVVSRHATRHEHRSRTGNLRAARTSALLLSCSPAENSRPDGLCEYERQSSRQPRIRMLEHRACRPWNYALCSDPVIPLKVIRTKPAAAGSYPFDPEHTPVKISVPVKPIDWELEKGRYTPRLPAEGIARAVSDRIEYLELIPYGCTELRLTVFPQCN